MKKTWRTRQLQIQTSCTTTMSHIHRGVDQGLLIYKLQIHYRQDKLERTSDGRTNMIFVCYSLDYSYYQLAAVLSTYQRKTVLCVNIPLVQLLSWLMRLCVCLGLSVCPSVSSNTQSCGLFLWTFVGRSCRRKQSDFVGGLDIFSCLHFRNIRNSQRHHKALL